MSNSNSNNSHSPNINIQDVLQNSISRVFNTMLNSKISTDLTPSLPQDSSYIIANVPFDGLSQGFLQFTFPIPLANSITCTLLSLSIDEFNQENPDDLTKDAIGEIVNMSSGYFKNSLTDQGQPCSLKVPSTNYSESLPPLDQLNSNRFFFSANNSPFIVDLQILPQLKTSTS